MSNFNEDALLRHVRGATVVHQSPFSSIEVPSIADALSAAECEKWVVPFYRVSFRSLDSSVAISLTNIYKEITAAVVEMLLTDFDWRPRLTGAFFAALKRFASVEDRVGRLLVRSDLCFAGRLYCVALAEFNTPNGLDYLERYLEYYLTRPDLDYDQADAMGAIAYLDLINRTKHFEKFRPLWDNYVSANPWKPNLDRSVAGFADEMGAVHKYRALAEARSSPEGCGDQTNAA